MAGGDVVASSDRAWRTERVQHLRMAELSARSGVAASTIRHYLRLGLLPEPLRTARTMAYYGPEHVERLTWIRRRLRAGATLHKVAQELDGQTNASPDAADDPLVHSTQRARLIEAGRAVFLRNGFDHVSVEDVVKRARVGKAAFYRHFTGKRDLLTACLAAEFDWYEIVTDRETPSWDRLMRYPDLFANKRFRALVSLFALLRQADASRGDHHGRAVDVARARLRKPLEADLRAWRAAGNARNPQRGDERLQAEMLLSVAEYAWAYAATTGAGDLPATVRHAWMIAVTDRAHA